MADGPQIQVPAHAVSGTGTLDGAQVSSPAPAPKGLALAGPVYRLEFTGARLTGKVQLTLPVPLLTANGPDAALLAYYDTKTRAWVPVPATYNPRQHTLTALTPHLSVWTTLQVDTGKITAGAVSLLKGFLDISSTTSQPVCPGHADLAAAGIRADSDKGDLAKWCAGVTGGQPLLRVSDNRQYTMEADYPSSSQATHVGDADPLTSAIITDVSQALSPPPNGVKSVLIPGGETEQFTVPSGLLTEVNVLPSGEAYLIDALLYGADTLAMTEDDIPGAPKQNLTKTEHVIKLALDSKDCVTQADHLLQDKSTSATSAGAYFRDDIEWAVGCLGDEWQAGYGLAGEIGTFAVTVVLWLADGIRLLVDGVRSLIDSVVYWNNYRIAINSPAQASCTSQALATAARAYEATQHDSNPAEINAFACDQGYAEILYTVTTTAAGGLQYQAAMAFKSVSGSWPEIGDGDYIPPGSFGMPASVGQTLTTDLQANSGGDTGVSF